MITLDNRTLESFGYRALIDHYHEAIPNIRRKTMTIPGMPGRWDFGSELESKTFEIPIQALSDSSLSLQHMQNELVAFLMDEYGNPRLIKMVFDYEPDKFYTVKIDGTVAPVLRAHILSNSTLPFIAHDPYKYLKVDSDEITWGSEEITFEWDLLLGHENDFDGTLHITSNETLTAFVSGLAVKPIFVIEGTANNFKVTSGNYSFTLPNFSSGKWEINFNNYSVYRNGQEQILDGIDEFILLPGENDVKITGTNMNIDFGMKYTDKYN